MQLSLHMYISNSIPSANNYAERAKRQVVFTPHCFQIFIVSFLVYFISPRMFRNILLNFVKHYSVLILYCISSNIVNARSDISSLGRIVR